MTIAFRGGRKWFREGVDRTRLSGDRTFLATPLVGSTAKHILWLVTSSAYMEAYDAKANFYCGVGAATLREP